MTSLLPAPRRTRPTGEARADAAHRRPLVLLAFLAGVVAAASTLLVCLAAGVVGWFLTDAGAHGAPRDGLRVGALGWLMAHGSGVHVAGTHVTAVPLGLTLLAAVVVWRLGLRLGDSVSGHGPDADAIADGVRDWTVASATALFTAGYALVVVVTHHLAATPATAPSLVRPLTWTVLLCGVVGGTAVAVGSGRAAIWTSFLPISLRAAAAAAWRTLVWFLAVATVVFVVALLGHWDDAANVMSQLHTSPGAAALLVGLSALLLPHASLFTGSYLLGPGFAVGAHTLVSPTAVVLGPLPLFPLLAALPGTGPTPGWVGRPARTAAADRRRRGPPHPAALPDDAMGRRRAARGRRRARLRGRVRLPRRSLAWCGRAGPDGRGRAVRLPGPAPRHRDLRPRRTRRVADRHLARTPERAGAQRGEATITGR